LLFDTCALIDFLLGDMAALTLIKSDPARAMSVITRAELMAGASSPEDELQVLKTVRQFLVHDVNPDIADLAGKLRRDNRLKLPDALILATARVTGQVLATRDTNLLKLKTGVMAY
jgi:predicted nucleic acid-binding protein